MKTLNAVFLTIIIFSGTLVAQNEDSKLGSEITLTEKTEISDIIGNPENYLGQVVLVEGEVLEVCPKMGCWMELKSNDSVDEDGNTHAKIKVKVKDGEIVFPMDAIGQTALVEGKVYKIDLTQEEALDYFEHLAEETGQEFDPSKVTGPLTLYQIKGLGAEIYLNEG